MNMISDNELLRAEPFSEEKFKHPPKQFGIIPFWFINGEMDYGEMEFQLKEFAGKGIPGIFFHSRFGIKDYMPYLGEEWLKRYAFTAQKGKELGIQTWVYDEYNWPSGTCDKQVMAQNPSLTSRYLKLVTMDIPGHFFTFMEGTDSRYNDLERSEPVYACAILSENLKNGVFDAINLMPNLSFDKVISWQTPEGPWKLCYFVEQEASWYADVLNPEATKSFIRNTHQKYKDYVSEPVSDSIAGFFTDEPAMLYFECNANNTIIPWTANMFKVFMDANGYDLRNHLPQLYFDIGDYHKIRYDFWSTLSAQYEKAYYKQIRQWCEDNGVIFTGHVLYEEWLRRHARTGGNLFNILRNFHMTGIDHIYPRIGTREMPQEHVAIKIASSAAHQNGSVRLICESMGGSFWDCTMERMKWIADWEYVLGVNMFNPHGFHYSIEGERKRDWPPSQFYHHTWWKYYGLFNDYLKRIGYLMTGGTHVARIAILYPINHIWSHYVPTHEDPFSAAAIKSFEFMTDALLRLHYDYDYIDEDVFCQAELVDGRICVREEAYSLLILPPMTHIKEQTLLKMKRFSDQGGNILGSGMLPESMLECEAGGNSSLVKEIFGLDPVPVNQAFIAGREPDNTFMVKTNPNGNGGKTGFVSGPGFAALKDYATLARAVSALVEWDVQIDDDELFCLHRVKDGLPFYFIINPTGNGRDAAIRIRNTGIPKYCDLLSGNITNVFNYQQKYGILTLNHRFPAYGSAMFFLETGDSSRIPHVQNANFHVTGVGHGIVSGYTASEAAEAVYVDGETETLLSSEVQQLPEFPLSETWNFQPEIDNVLLIKTWKFAIADKSNESFFAKEYETGCEWLDFTMGCWEPQLPYEREEKTYPVDVLYKAVFHAEFIPDDVKILIDGFRCESSDLYINGVKVAEPGERSFLDAEIKQIYIRKYLTCGINEISIRMRVQKKTHGLLDYIKITGSFSLSDSEPHTILPPKTEIKTGSWTTQGYPYFSGTGTMTQEVDIPPEYLSGRMVQLKVDCGTDVLAVSVNGQELGVCLWPPYEMDITKALKPGLNRVSLSVTNTLVNMLDGVKRDSGVFYAKLHSFSKVILNATS